MGAGHHSPSAKICVISGSDNPQPSFPRTPTSFPRTTPSFPRRREPSASPSPANQVGNHTCAASAVPTLATAPELSPGSSNRSSHSRTVRTNSRARKPERLIDHIHRALRASERQLVLRIPISPHDHSPPASHDAKDDQLLRSPVQPSIARLRYSATPLPTFRKRPRLNHIRLRRDRDLPLQQLPATTPPPSSSVHILDFAKNSSDRIAYPVVRAPQLRICRLHHQQTAFATI